ncbi:MAG: hypothetical protein CM15mP126_3940 [Gammaproteobacteria bacterium]|nr:MAG: hypothetical protein CM15mP126_3940 [Gammaproteobacteria bacterium]
MGIESTSGGSGSNLLEGFVNIPLSQNSAIRLVVIEIRMVVILTLFRIQLHIHSVV